jgi:hypothetical protein
MVVTSLLAQVVVRGALTAYIAILALGVGMGDAGIRMLGAALGLGGIVGAIGILGLTADRRLAALFTVALVGWGRRS